METLHALYEQISLAQFVLVALTVGFAGFLRGFVGFGAALIIAMVLSAVYSPTWAIPIATLAGMPVTLQLLPAARRDAQPRFVLPFGVAAFASAPVGAWVLVSLDATVMRMVISIFVLVLVVLMYGQWRLLATTSPAASAAAGAAAGFVQGASSVSGPMAAMAALSRPGKVDQQRANVIGAVTALNLCGFIPFLYYGLFTLEVIIISVAILPLYIGATWFGARFFALGGRRLFRDAALLSMALIGVLTFALAARDYNA